MQQDLYFMTLYFEYTKYERQQQCRQSYKRRPGTFYIGKVMSTSVQNIQCYKGV